MNLHILTPFYRKENFDIQLRRLSQFKSWTCIVSYEEHMASYGDFFKDKNCQHIEYVCPNFYGDAAYCKINRYIDSSTKYIQDDDYYMPLMDDDSVPANFMKRL